MRARLIVNPSSGSETAAQQLELINTRLREVVGEMDIVMTTGAGDAARAAEDAARSTDCEYLFVAGGDGTLNEALNGLHRTERGLERITVGIVPVGTGNDFSAALGIPEDLESALSLLAAGRTMPVDLGMLSTSTEERVFVNVSAGGFTAEVSDATDPKLKTFAGKLAYLISGASVLFDYEPAALRVRVHGATEVDRQYSVQLFAVANSRLIGGGREIAPQAVIDDGLLDLCIVEGMPTMDFLALLPSLSDGSHVEDPRVHYLQASRFEIGFDRTLKINTDGEVLEADRCIYRVLPGAVTMLCGDAPFSRRELPVVEPQAEQPMATVTEKAS